MKTIDLKENSERLDLPCTDKDILFYSLCDTDLGNFSRYGI